MAVNEDAAIVAERTSMYEMLRTLSPQEWDRPSLCAGWRVRDVATHVHLAVTISLWRVGAGMLAHRGDFNRFMAGYVPRLGNRPVERNDVERRRVLDQLCQEFLSRASTHGFTLNDVLSNLEQRRKRRLE